MANYTETDLVQAGTLDKMFRRFAQLVTNPNAARPHYNAETGRYDNLADWLSIQRDGLVYGVQIPKYDYSPVTTAIKTGANVGLTLEASSDSSAGRNDYKSRALFMCLRCNGGVDPDGTNYVTAIEGYDDRFDPTQNTYALTPVYYKRVTEDDNYKVKEYTDTPRTGFKPCVGAYTSGGVLRDFILRACYMDSAGDFSSKSGTQPAGSVGSPVAVGHCANYDFNQSKARTVDGLTYLTYGDIAYQEDFMELMLGVKAPRSVAVGCVSYNFQYQVAAAEEGVKRVLLTDAQAANILVGSALSVGTRSNNNSDRGQATMHDIAKCAKVVSKTAQGDGTTAINLDLETAVNIEETYWVSTMPWPNGSCDNVLGTFGAKTPAGLTNGTMPFKFQNVEWNLGIWETMCNMYSTSVNANGKNTHTWHIAPDVSQCSGLNAGAGWTNLDQQTVGNNNQGLYIKDYKEEKGARVPEAVGGTSTTGFCTAWHSGSGSGDRETLVGGLLGNGADAGVGCVGSNHALGVAHWGIGGRSSAIGHSAQAE